MAYPKISSHSKAVPSLDRSHIDINKIILKKTYIGVIQAYCLIFHLNYNMGTIEFIGSYYTFTLTPGRRRGGSFFSHALAPLSNSIRFNIVLYYILLYDGL